MIEELSSFFSTNGAKYGCISAYIVGSYANNTYDKLSDLDLVVIGKDTNSYVDIKNLGFRIKNHFVEKLAIECFYYCEPSQELLCLLDPENLKKLRVHLIYHPLNRFQQYIQNRDQVLISWKANCYRLYGDELLNTEVLLRNQVDNNVIFSNTINLIIQNLHNSFLIADISSNPIYYLKVYKFMLKRLKEIEHLPKYSLISSQCNFSLESEFDQFRHFLKNCNPSALKVRILGLEKILHDLEKMI